MKNNGNILILDGLLWLTIPAIFFIGLWLVVIKPLGPNLSQLPGDLGDTRFNNYILEHNYRWISGEDPSLWDAPFSYPYPQTLTFSDNHFGSMLFYDSFRWLGLERESAFQAWYILSYFLTFAAGVFVLKKLNLTPLAIAMGAFFFTFGLPVLAQEVHTQLSYRFCIPLACYSFWQFFQKPRFKHLTLTIFWVVWQFYLSIYLGFFLSLLLIIAAVVFPIFHYKLSIRLLGFWPRSIKQAWESTSAKNNIFFLVVITTLFLALIMLFLPYIKSSRIYNFYRPWEEISQMLPRLQSYFIADNSLIWPYFSSSFTNLVNYRWEHQLFIGVSPSILLILGLIWRFKSSNKNLVSFFMGAAGILILLTLNIGGFSLYKILWKIPGFNSIRAMTRLILILMWPVAMFISVVFDSIIMASKEKTFLLAIGLLLLGLMIAESVFFEHSTFSITEADDRLQTLREQLPSTLPEEPILFVWNPQQLWYLNELDSMLLSQDLGIPAMNGYSGNLPDGYGETRSCDEAVTRIIRYMNFMKVDDQTFYNDLLSRIVAIGPEDCQWSQKTSNLSFTQSSGPFPQELFSGISINILSMAKIENYLSIEIRVENHSTQTLPAESSSGNPFLISWRFIDADTGNPISGFDTRKSLISDIPAGEHTLLTINTITPDKGGRYLVEISAVQELVAWFHDRGMTPAISNETIDVDDSNQWTLSNQ